MTILSFTLGMPCNNGWNGKWTGEENLYVRTRTFKGKANEAHAKELLAMRGGYYTYNFGDGWGASVTVREITGPEKRKLDKATKGFCGYDWMIDSIVNHKMIRGGPQ